MRYAVVTGATKGIGLAIAKMLLGEGYYVIATYAHDEAAARMCEKTLTEVSNMYELLKVDQGSKTDMHRFANYLLAKGTIECIVFNAGVTLRKDLNDISDEEWENVMQVNVNAPVFLLRDIFRIIPHNSRIVFIGSEMAIYPHATSLAYGVSKVAVHGLARNLVKNFESTGTTVNVVAPGFVETAWQQNKPQNIRKNICDKTSAKRFATVEEVADAVRFCINNAFVNGAVIEVSGGYNYK